MTDASGIGTGLGRLLDRLVREAGLTRAVIAGGDTSSPPPAPSASSR